MKKNLKILFIQLCVLAIGCFIGEAVFGLPKWLGLVIAGLMFYLVFFIIQIKGAMSNIKDEVSSDGIAGARLRPILMTAMTTILAMFTSAIGIGDGSDMIRPMAIAIIGGLIYGTILTLIVIPCIYDAFNKEKSMVEEEL